MLTLHLSTRARLQARPDSLGTHALPAASRHTRLYCEEALVFTVKTRCWSRVLDTALRQHAKVAHVNVGPAHLNSHTAPNQRNLLSVECSETSCVCCG